MSNETKPENMDNQQAENPSNPPTQRTQNKDVEDSGFSEPCPEKPRNEPKNTGVAIKNAESESLNSLLAYDSDSSSSSEMMKLNLNWQVRDDSDDSDSSTSSSSEEEQVSETESETEPEPEQSKGAIKKDKPPQKNAEELENLPPVPDLSSLNINTDNENFVHMGNVLGIVHKLVTVEAFPNTPAYDLDTLLFLDNGKKPLGFVFDVLGQVSSPIYAIRFNSIEDIKNLGVQVGNKVYSAPTSKHTQYVFLQQLLKMKGSDASWVGDAECPTEFADFSDDENECYQRHGNRKLTPNVKRTRSGDSYKKFETAMNKMNLLNTKFSRYMDSYKQARLNRAKLRHGRGAPQISSVPPFDPSIPPPGVQQQVHYHPRGGVQYIPPEYLGAYRGGENNNSASQGYAPPPTFFMNNFVANLSHQANSANYFTNHAGNNHPGPSHE